MYTISFQPVQDHLSEARMNTETVLPDNAKSGKLQS